MRSSASERTRIGMHQSAPSGVISAVRGVRISHIGCGQRAHAVDGVNLLHITVTAENRVAAGGSQHARQSWCGDGKYIITRCVIIRRTTTAIVRAATQGEQVGVACVVHIQRQAVHAHTPTFRT